MSCTHLNTQLDQYLDGELTGLARWTVEDHLRGCCDCQQAVDRAQALAIALGALPLSGPRSGFFDRALDKAAREGARTPAHRGRVWAVASALAASLAAFVVAGVLLKSPEVEPQAPAIAGLSMSVHETRTVNLVFSAVHALPEATLTVSLPPGIELAGYGERREFRWKTSLREGKNVLPLELTAREAQGGLLVAELKHEQKRRTFRVDVTVI